MSNPPDDLGEPTPEHPLLSGLRQHLGEAVLAHHQNDHDVWARVEVSQWARAAYICRRQLNCNYFSFLSGMDWQPNPHLDGEKAFSAEARVVAAQPIISDPLLRMGGGESRFQVIARVQDVDRHVGITLVADLDDENPTAPSWTSTYRGADWHEREAWEMFGFDFQGHPGLRNIYLPEEFVGHPLRKDYALVARIVRPWPGLVDMEEMPAVETPAGESKGSE